MSHRDVEVLELQPADLAQCEGFGPLANNTGSADGPSRPPSALTIVAHDLRGPLANLRQLIGLIEAHVARQSTEKALSCSELANATIDGMEDLINSMLERVLKTGDPLDFEPKCIALEYLVARGIMANLPAAEEKAVKVLFKQTDPMSVNGDQRLLLQVIDNLVGNAIKHSSAGMTVTCSLFQLANRAVLTVEDNGNGLTEKDLQRAFRPFTKLSSRSQDKARSFGLGLWIVKLIVEQHGGRITASSDGPGAGSIFRVILPLCEPNNMK